MKHPNPFISAFLEVPEFSWKNDLRRWLAFSPLVPSCIQDFSPIRGYEQRVQLKKGDLVLDVGAFPGDYALYAARKVGPAGHVYCLEPEAANREVLERNIRKSGMDHLTVIPVGLWNECTQLPMSSDGVASHIQEQRSDHEIEVLTLTELFIRYKLPRVQMLKMDIEGAELEALEGMETFLAEMVDAVCVASYHIRGVENTSARIEAILRQAGFSTESSYPKHLTTYGWRASD